MSGYHRRNPEAPIVHDAFKGGKVTELLPPSEPITWQITAVGGGWDGVKRSDGPLVCKMVSNDPKDLQLIAAAPQLAQALRVLYEETADYIQTNNLGPVHHNCSMQLARAALLEAGVIKPKTQPKP